jgi:hypothetical protein
MGLMDKAKFWKKEDDLGDLSDLGDFGLDEKPGASAGTDHGVPPGGGLGEPGGGLGDLPPLTEPTKAGMHEGVPTHMEEVHPTQGSQEMGDQLGLKPAPPAHETPARPAAQPAPQAAPAYQQGPDIGDLAKDIEIVHAKLDAIKSSLDSINQRLATLERMASGDTGNKTRYTW